MEGRLLAVLGICMLVSTIVAYRPKLLQPALDEPLKVGCMANTPIILNQCIMVWPHTNKLVNSIQCKLSRVTTLNCTSTAVMFTGVPAGTHRLVITAQTPTEEVSATYRLIIPADPDVCTTHLINHGVTVDNGTAVAEFSGYGPYTGFMCKLDGPIPFICRSPLTLRDLPEGEHWLRVTPVGCREKERQTFFFNVTSPSSTSSSVYSSSSTSAAASS